MFSQFPECRDYFRNIGWLSIISEWFNSDRLELSLTAAKALINFDSDGNLVSDATSLQFANV